MLSVGNTVRKMPSMTGLMLWPPAHDRATAQQGNIHPENILPQCFWAEALPL